MSNLSKPVNKPVKSLKYTDLYIIHGMTCISFDRFDRFASIYPRTRKKKRHKKRDTDIYRGKPVKPVKNEIFSASNSAPVLAKNPFDRFVDRFAL
jgi:hypothetical protein